MVSLRVLRRWMSSSGAPQNPNPVAGGLFGSSSSSVSPGSPTTTSHSQKTALTIVCVAAATIMAGFGTRYFCSSASASVSASATGMFGSGWRSSICFWRPVNRDSSSATANASLIGSSAHRRSFSDLTATILTDPSEIARLRDLAIVEARESGSIRKFETVVQTTVDPISAIPFVTRMASHLLQKPVSSAEPSSAVSAGPTMTPLPTPQPPRNPFLPPFSSGLFVANVSSTHRCLQNKFPLVDGHLLVITNEFESQKSALTADDFYATVTVLRSFPGDHSMSFFNCGEQSGASQPHKHLQVIPTPLDPTAQNGFESPLDALISAAANANTSRSTPNTESHTSEIFQVPEFRFQHGCIRIRSGLTDPALARAVFHAYRNLRGALKVGGPDPALADDGTPSSPFRSFNMLFTSRWMIIVPRRTGQMGPVSVNAMAFSGALFLPTETISQTIADAGGPIRVLEHVTWPLEGN